MSRLFLPLAVILFAQACWWSSAGEREFPRVSHAKAAERLREEGKVEDAVKEYKAHIAARFEDKKRNSSENPYFYLIMIGDTYLQAGRADEALNSYLEAKDWKVDTGLIIDRLRGLARYHEKQAQYERAIELLKKYRTLDDLLFDADIDQLHKTMVEREESKRSYQ